MVKHGTIMLIFLRNNSLQLSFFIERGVSGPPSPCWLTLGDSHYFPSCPFRLSQSFSSPLNPVSLAPSHPVIERLHQISHQTAALQIFFLCFLSKYLLLTIHPLALFLTVCPLLRRQWRRQTGREDIRWCTTRLERKNGIETA